MVDDPQSAVTDTGRIEAETLDRLSEARIRALADPRARVVLRHLSEDSTAPLSRLADVVAGSEAAATGSVVGPSERDSNRAVLHHKTLPLLAACGLVDYDPDDCTVTDTTISPAVSALLEQVD
ncbi:DUF7344 domain-containing protein [Halosimplex salinum]|uniref:DUF7344 domain-containing protein n=1 Tax=Halosimplex salinum TaxID=1710538 RepID=UPI0013DDF71B|nr:hypothetical protein [Halosimplex salinum]